MAVLCNIDIFFQISVNKRYNVSLLYDEAVFGNGFPSPFSRQKRIKFKVNVFFINSITVPNNKC